MPKIINVPGASAVYVGSARLWRKPTNPAGKTITATIRLYEPRNTTLFAPAPPGHTLPTPAQIQAMSVGGYAWDKRIAIEDTFTFGDSWIITMSDELQTAFPGSIALDGHYDVKIQITTK